MIIRDIAPARTITKITATKKAAKKTVYDDDEENEEDEWMLRLCNWLCHKIWICFVVFDGERNVSFICIWRYCTDKFDKEKSFRTQIDPTTSDLGNVRVIT